MVLQLYIDPASVNCHKVVAALDYMGTPYEIKHTDYMKGEHKTAEYAKINPNATLPSATDDGVAITQSNAIMQYAADKNGGSSAYPTDPKQRALVNCWLHWEASGWFRSNYVYLVENILKGISSMAPDQETLAAEEPNWLKLANVLNDQLGKTKYVVGDDITIADFAIMAPMHLYQIQKLPLDKVPNIQRWIGDIEKIPAWQSSQAYVNKVFGLDSDRYVRATLNYTKYSDDRSTEVYFYEDERAADAHHPGDDAQEVSIHDGWDRKGEYSEDKHGFSLHEFKSTYPRDKWQDETLVKEKFYPEVAEFVKNTVGAARVLVFDHTIRTKVNEAKKLTDESQTSQRAPVRLVHCDYTSESGPLRVRQLLGDEADDLLSRRVAFLNVWKPLAKVEEMPLAMCDITSSPKEDFFKLFLRYRDRTGENYVMRYSPEHRWVYFPDMDENHCIILKTYESDESRARFVGHSAFEDPTSKPDAPYRESVEIRTIAFF
ncbi:glutathione s-transferase [Pochonia chlamydosporia 170]|uniref:Glutathione s-transferase n=1 Tax=Pochonia chlamydosporia 170 TaxID=1380566 RepID=A0A179G8R8_METCM|nr:glutathione s-transferase [Pochonia chlamydosporia 170]OAQ74204.1 glutathione s-transferase [Pochonia chlamydosporia 170]